MDQQIIHADQKQHLEDVVGVVSVYIRVSNIKRSVEWYSQYLGCVVKQQNEGYASVHLPWGATLDFWQDDNLVVTKCRVKITKQKEDCREVSRQSEDGGNRHPC